MSKFNDIKESKIGRELSDITTKRVILLVFTMIATIPFFNTSTY